MIEEMLADGGFGFQWHITNRCAGKCHHCYQSGTDSEKELPVADLKRIADAIMAAVPAPVTINITGGEPFMYQFHGQSRGVFELMAHLSTFDKLGEMNIITSVRGMDRSVIRDLKTVSKLTSVKVSLESHDPAIDDSIRGLGHHKMAVDEIRQMVEAGLRVVIMTTLSKRNYHSVNGLCALAGQLDTQGVIFERFVPLGNGVKEMGDMTITSEEWREVLHSLSASTQTPFEELLPYEAFWVGADGQSISGAPCSLGASSMALMPDGTVYPCRRVPTPIGKLPDDGMENILKKLEEYSRSPQKCFSFDF
jgi:MoaA/NifB/PqqE/SkfB family radical SAM enzyme